MRRKDRCRRTVLRIPHRAEEENNRLYRRLCRSASNGAGWYEEGRSRDGSHQTLKSSKSSMIPDADMCR
jgi:hypothetical protein